MAVNFISNTTSAIPPNIYPSPYGRQIEALFIVDPNVVGHVMVPGISGKDAIELLRSFPFAPYCNRQGVSGRVIPLYALLQKTIGQTTDILRTNTRFAFYLGGLSGALQVKLDQIVIWNFDEQILRRVEEQVKYCNSLPATTCLSVGYNGSYHDPIETKPPKQVENKVEEGLQPSLFKVELIKLNQDD